jgi:gas vesicle protein
MKFITGLLTGVALGAAGAVYYSVKSGRDLRSMYEEIRAEVDAGNYEALGQRVERGFADIQAEIETRVNQVRAGASDAFGDAEDGLDDAADRAGSALDEADPDELGADAESVVDDATDAIDSVVDAAGDAAGDARDAASEQVDAWNRDR